MQEERKLPPHALDALVEKYRAVIDIKLHELACAPHAPGSERRLEFAAVHEDGTRYSSTETRQVTARAFAHFAETLGAEFLAATSAVRLEQMTLVSMDRNHNGPELLASVLNAFMVAYMTPETTGEAYDLLVRMCDLRNKVEARRTLKLPAWTTQSLTRTLQ